VDQLEGLAGQALELVGGVEPTGAVGDDLGGAQRRQALAALAALGADDRGHRLALEVLHRDEVRAVLLAQVVDIDDVRVPDLGGDAGLLEERLGQGLLGGQPRVDGLHHHQLLEGLGPALPGQVDLGHAALADPRDQLVAPEGPARGCHRRRG
jgi:hypothetical protein